MRKAIAVICAVLACGAAHAQTWVEAEYNLWLWAKGESVWTPDEATLETALVKLETAFRAEKKSIAPRAVPDWGGYTLEYQGRIADDRRIIRISGDCAFERRYVTREDGTVERLIVTGGGGTCFFYATYDTTTDDVTEFIFNGPY